MALLLKGGMLMTMTEQGTYAGDVLIAEGRIRRVAPEIDTAETADAQVLDVTGCVVLPGMIDMCIDAAALHHDYMYAMMLNSGITSALVRDDERREMCIMDSEGCRESGVIAIRTDGADADWAIEQARTGLEVGKKVLLSGMDERMCTRFLEAIGEGGRGVILLNPPVTEGLAERIAACGCDALIGVRRCGASPWQDASRLDALGVRVAVSTCYPAAKLRLLPVCVSLCVRDGLPRSRALCTVTVTAADILGFADRGRIAPGMRADLAVFDGDPLLLATSHVMTLAAGRMVRRSCR